MSWWAGVRGLDSRARALAEERERVRELRQGTDIAEITAQLDGMSWPVSIRQRAGIYEITGRSSLMQVHVARTVMGLLVSIPTANNCGFVPDDCRGRDIQYYCTMKNDVDAETVATAVRYLVERGMVA